MPIYVNDKLVPPFQFNGGERNIVLPFECIGFYDKDRIVVKAYLYNSNDIMDMLLTIDALRPTSKKIVLEIPYLPYARQDRKCNEGEALSIKVMANLINSMNVDAVWIDDAHSDVATALINNCVNLEQHDIIQENPEFIKLIKHYELTLISPDAGAEKKIRKVQKLLGADVVYCTKERDPKTGEIKGVTIPNCDLNGKKCIIIDDICDGGRTFIELAKKLKADRQVSHVFLYVTHGIFSNGFEELQKHLTGIFVKNIFPQDTALPEFVTILD